MIDHRWLFLYFSLVVIGGTAVKAQDPPRPTALSLAEKQRLHDRIRLILEKHRDLPIDRESPDYSLFAIVGEAAKNEQEFFDELIKLTVIRDVPSHSTEKFTPTGFSPAGRELVGIGSRLREAIEAHLQNGRLSEWQTWVLSDVLRIYQLVEFGPDGVTIQPIFLESSGDLWATFPSQPSANPVELDRKSAEAVPESALSKVQRSDTKPSPVTVRYTAVLILVCGSILFWQIFFKRRNRS